MLSKVARTCDVMQLLGNVIVTIISIVTQLHSEEFLYASSDALRSPPESIRCSHDDKTYFYHRFIVALCNTTI